MRRTMLILALGGSAACASSPNINVGHEPDGGVAGAGGASGAAGSAGLGGFGGDNALTAVITQLPSEMAIDVITVGCAGDCKQVLVVASGGMAPYTFHWNDGVGGDSREICATDDTVFTVTVNDTANNDPEFHYPGQQATASVTAHVLQCPSDGGAGAICLDNPSLEGTAAPNVGVFSVAPWVDCFPPIGADVFDAQLAMSVSPAYPPPTDGNTAVYMVAVGDTGETIGTPLCAPLQPGRAVSLLLDLWSQADDTGTMFGHVEIYGGDTACARDELLWTSPALSGEWQTLCATFTPTSEHTALFVMPHGIASRNLAIGIDNLVPVDHCP